MNKKKLLGIIRKGETQNLEFTENAEDVGKSVCSLANTNNGLILVGVSDDRKIIGCTEKDEQKIANIAHTCKPSIYPKIEKVEVNDKNVFVVEVKKSDQLHSYRNVAYKRIGTHDKPLSPEEVIEFAKATGKIKFDEEICERATLKDIDEEKVRLFIKEAKRQRKLDIPEDAPVEDALMRLMLLKDRRPTNAAILLFAEDPQRFFIQSEVKCIRFKGTDVTGPMIDFKVIEGDIIDQLKKAEDFIFEHIPIAAWIEDWKLQRQEKWLYPPKAIREALANALAHRDYESPSKVQVRIFDDRMEFWNPGRLPEGWTVEKLKEEHESKPSNPLIFKAFFWIRYVEEVGTGTNKIIKWCKDWGLPEPEFKFTGTSLVVTFKKPPILEDLEKLGLNERQIKAVDYVVKKRHITNKEYQELNNITKRTATRDLTDLVKKGIFVTVGRGKRELKYVLVLGQNVPKMSQKMSQNKSSNNDSQRP